MASKTNISLNHATILGLWTRFLTISIVVFLDPPLAYLTWSVLNECRRVVLQIGGALTYNPVDLC